MWHTFVQVFTFKSQLSQIEQVLFLADRTNGRAYATALSLSS